MNIDSILKEELYKKETSNDIKKILESCLNLPPEPLIENVINPITSMKINSEYLKNLKKL